MHSVWSIAFSGEAAAVGWEERFAQPPADARILKIIHNWPDPPDAQDQIISKLRTQGFGGVVCNVSFDQYLESEAKWQAFTRAVNEAKQAGMALWLYDERGYPSGNAGGLTLRDHPEWEARGLLVADAEIAGRRRDAGTAAGQTGAGAAFPVRDGRSGFGEAAWISPGRFTAPSWTGRRRPGAGASWRSPRTASTKARTPTATSTPRSPTSTCSCRNRRRGSSK